MGSNPLTQVPADWQPVRLGHPDFSKLADSLDSLNFYFRKLDPRKENFLLSATFEVEDASGVNYQTGYGLAVMDTVASPNKISAHRNQALTGRFRAADGRNYACGLRIVGGYSDPGAQPQGRRRRLDPSRLFPTQDPEDIIRKGDRHRFTLAKTDAGLEASMETPSGTETIRFPGCDFLLEQDREAIYVGFAIAGPVRLKISDIVFEKTPGRLSHTPRGSIRSIVPDYPFGRNLLPQPDGGGRLRDTVLRVGPDGSPMSLSEALRTAGPGCEILLEDGVYREGPYYIPPGSSGSRSRPIVLRALHPGKAILDGASLRAKLPALTLRGRHWLLEGLVFRNAPSAGLFICGSDNVVRSCEAVGNGDTGILVCTFPGTSRRSWPRRNRVESCISHDNCDPMRCNADGFGAKRSVGKGNGFYACKSFHNIDDGFDLYTKSTLGRIRPVVLDHCEAFCNGWLTAEEKPEAVSSTGNGFKLGGENQRVRHRLRDCTAHDNARVGFHANSNPAALLSGCRAWGNREDFHLRQDLVYMDSGRFFSRFFRIFRPVRK